MLRRGITAWALVFLAGGASVHAQQAQAKAKALEAEGKYGAATKLWTVFLRQLQKQAANNAQAKEQYFNAYFHRTRTLYLYAVNDPAVHNPDKLVDFGAKQIVDLEFSRTKDGWKLTGGRYRQLLQQQPQLKEAYDRLKKARTAGAK